MRSYLVSVQPQVVRGPERLYLLSGDLTSDELHALTTALLHDPVAETMRWEPLETLKDIDEQPVVEIAFRPGVTDNEAETILTGAQHLGIQRLYGAKTLRRYTLPAYSDPAALTAYAEEHLLNPLIETAYIAVHPETAARHTWYSQLLQTPAEHTPHITTVALRAASPDDLERISREGILALSLAEMQAIQTYFRDEGRDPTDGELETIAQTWSEHCRHKTFRARIEYSGSASSTPVDPQWHPALAELEQGEPVLIDGLLRYYLMRATEQVRGEDVLSAFVDNAGIVVFDEDFEISFKVETHNHPSALEPFGGANTGVGGVVRDVLGVSAQPIAVTDVLCFGPPDYPEDKLTPGILPPQRIRDGVVAGVRDYGNKLGIPNINGAVWYDEGYLANPLVFCGTIGIAPRGSHPAAIEPGDAIVVIGGRTGRDGIHGATFSSTELTHDTAELVGAAVQIGDPVTEKTVIDVLLQARELGLYSAITDCGAGGLSSAVGEMGEASGAEVQLRDVPLKYPGLQPWEIWISEAQERMVVAVPPGKVQALLELCASEDVEATVIGHFTDDQFLTVKYHDQVLVDLAMSFLHSGGVRSELVARWNGQATGAQPQTARITDANATLKALLSHPIIASKEKIVRSYDHEVQAATILKPMVGINEDGPSDGTALQPRLDSHRGIVVGCGINPRYGKLDPYWMGLAAVDEALRNIVAAGGDPQQTWILDNFCWGDPRLPDRLGGLVRAAAACYDAALAYGTPYISGKDSLNNEYRDAQGNRIAIPPTLLISAMAIVPDVLRTVSMDAKAANNRIYLVGMTRDELGGSVWGAIGGRDNQQVPRVDLAQAPHILQALHRTLASGLVQACHDLSEGGLGVAAAEMAFAGGLGMELDLGNVICAGELDAATMLWSESPTRFLVEVREADATEWERSMGELPWAQIGFTRAEQQLRISDAQGTALINSAIDALKRAWQTS